MMSIRGILVLLTFLLGACATPTAAVDLTIRSNGCIPATVIIPPEREPILTIRNTTADAMVVSIPTMDRWVEVAPGADSVLEKKRVKTKRTKKKEKNEDQKNRKEAKQKKRKKH